MWLWNDLTDMAQWFELPGWNSLCGGVLKTLMDKAVDEMEFASISTPKRTSYVVHIPATLSFRQTIQFCLCCVYSTRKNVRNVLAMLGAPGMAVSICRRFSLDWNISTAA